MKPMALAAEGARVTHALKAQHAAPAHMVPSRAADKLTPRRMSMDELFIDPSKL